MTQGVGQIQSKGGGSTRDLYYDLMVIQLWWLYTAATLKPVYLDGSIKDAFFFNGKINSLLAGKVQAAFDICYFPFYC